MANEKRLIDADKLKLAIRDDAEISGKDYARVKMHINDAPAVDAVEVVHGRWEHDSIGFSDFWTCSACRNDFFFDDDPTVIHARVNYCPNCGAKMDGDGNG